MDKQISIMPCLDMQNGRVVKGVHFVDIRDAGDPVECAKAYCRAGADELALLDITATIENRPTMLEVVRKVSEAATVPFTVGGGISDVIDGDHIQAVSVVLTDGTECEAADTAETVDAYPGCHPFLLAGMLCACIRRDRLMFMRSRSISCRSAGSG